MIRACTTADYDGALHAVRTAPDVLAAGGAQFDTDGLVERRAVPLVAFWTLVGPPQRWPVITSGRAPRNTREVALGPKTMRALGRQIGDQTEVRASAEDPTRPVTIVGEALVNDGFNIKAGEVAVVDARWFGPRLARRAGHDRSTRVDTTSRLAVDQHD